LLLCNAEQKQACGLAAALVSGLCSFVRPLAAEIFAKYPHVNSTEEVENVLKVNDL